MPKVHIFQKNSYIIKNWEIRFFVVFLCDIPSFLIFAKMRLIGTQMPIVCLLGYNRLTIKGTFFKKNSYIIKNWEIRFFVVFYVTFRVSSFLQKWGQPQEGERRERKKDSDDKFACVIGTQMPIVCWDTIDLQ